MPSIKNTYLILYNLASCAGWAYILYLTALCYSLEKSAGELYGTIKNELTIVQTAAAMEILHSLVGLVNSPVHTAILQVSSRLFLVWVVTIPSTQAQNHWSLYLMVTSWALVEVPRYLFYAVNIFVGSVEKIPAPLFFLRYSLFMVLYPSGISGEMLQMWTAYPFLNPIFSRWVLSTFFIYFVMGPFMVLNMWQTRQRSYKKRNASKLPPRKESGLVWPITDSKTGIRGSTETNRSIVAASLKVLDAKAGQEAENTKNWRFGYAKYLLKQVRLSLSTEEAALDGAAAGLDDAYNRFQFIRDDKTYSFKDAMSSIKGTFKTGFIKGSGAMMKAKKFAVPYGGKSGQAYYKFRESNKVIEGKELLEQLDRWSAYGTIEDSAADAIKQVVQHNEWLDLSDHYFVLLGATSAMGPLETLLSLGANIIAIDLDIVPIWTKLISKAKASPGSLTFPIKVDQKGLSEEDLIKNSGSNLLNATPEIANWLAEVCEGKNVTIGNYTYLDGALHVQLSLACDALISRVCEVNKNTSIAFLCTPTDVHCVPKEAHLAAKDSLRKAAGWQKFISSVSKMLKKNVEEPVKTKSNKDLYIVNGLSLAQGPNYALAKRMQHWRSLLARSKGHTVSTHIAPSTATKSVVHNAQFAAAYGGMHLFPPMEVFYQETSNAVMCALLIHDIRNPKAPGNGATKMENPLELMSYCSFHGGVWRCAYTIDSLGVISAVAFYLSTYSLQITIGLSCFVAYMKWLVEGEVNFSFLKL